MSSSKLCGLHFMIISEITPVCVFVFACVCLFVCASTADLEHVSIWAQTSVIQFKSIQTCFTFFTCWQEPENPHFSLSSCVSSFSVENWTHVSCVIHRVDHQKSVSGAKAFFSLKNSWIIKSWLRWTLMSFQLREDGIFYSWDVVYVLACVF